MEQPLFTQSLSLNSDPIATDESLLATIDGLSTGISQPLSPVSEEFWGYNHLCATLPEPHANDIDFGSPSLRVDTTSNFQPPYNGKESDTSPYDTKQHSLDGALETRFNPPRHRSQSTSNNGSNKRQKNSRDSSPKSNERPGEKARRERLLERNRIAANKCRQKKKEETMILESRYKEQSSKKDALMALFAQLQVEAFGLKNAVLKHAGCGDESIERHLAQSAMSITHNGVLSEPAFVAGTTSLPETSMSPIAVFPGSYHRAAESFESRPFQNSWVSQVPVPGKF